MTQIKIEVPADDHIALSAMADALQRIADERTVSYETSDSQLSVTDLCAKPFGVPTEFYGSNTEQPNANPEHSSQFDVELNRLDEELEASIHHENTKHDEAFEEAVDSTLDADGIPHDKRIHSEGATRLADNTWRLRKRPADKTEEEWTTYIDSVKAELKAVQDIPSVEPVEQGPFYWSHDESGSCGKVETIEELHRMIESDGLVNQIGEESYYECLVTGYDNTDNNVTPTTTPLSITPPVIDTDTPQGMSEANETPVAPVTPPTSLTPPVVEADKPSVTTFQELMLYMTSDAKKRGADNDMIKATLLEVDPALTAIPLIATRADLIPKFVEALEVKLA